MTDAPAPPVPPVAREVGALLKEGRAIEAVARVRREIEIATGRGDGPGPLGFLYHLLFSCFFQADDSVSAREALAAWEAAAPDDPATRLSVAEALYWQLRDADAAGTKAEEVIALARASREPDAADAHHRAVYLLGLIAADRGDFEAAIDRLEKSHIADWQLPAKLIAAGKGLDVCRRVLDTILLSPEGSGPAGTAGPQALTVVRALLRTLAEKRAAGG